MSIRTRVTTIEKDAAEWLATHCPAGGKHMVFPAKVHFHHADSPEDFGRICSKCGLRDTYIQEA